jgi:hypothetical protein
VAHHFWLLTNFQVRPLYLAPISDNEQRRSVATPKGCLVTGFRLSPEGADYPVQGKSIFYFPDDKGEGSNVSIVKDLIR